MSKLIHVSSFKTLILNRHTTCKEYSMDTLKNLIQGILILSIIPLTLLLVVGVIVLLFNFFAAFVGPFVAVILVILVIG